MQKGIRKKDLLGIENLSRDEIITILDTAVSMKEILTRSIKKVPTLRGKTIGFMFFEPSTRTQASFELAAKRLSADSVNVSSKSSSIQKGETILDTLKNIDAMAIDAFVIRHSSSGIVNFLAQHTEASVINAGDGMHEHPTQALLDIFTMREVFGKIKGLKVLIAGDVLHSRVARSNIIGLKKLGAQVTLFGPPTLVPPSFESIGASVIYDKNRAIKDKDIIMGLRIQRERISESFYPSEREYRKFFSIGKQELSRVKKGAIVMHPGPVNWGVELDFNVIRNNKNVILNQVTNGVAVRMSVLYHFIKVES